jgi:hypothetical protein
LQLSLQLEIDTDFGQDFVVLNLGRRHSSAVTVELIKEVSVGGTAWHWGVMTMMVLTKSKKGLEMISMEIRFHQFHHWVATASQELVGYHEVGMA